MISDFIKLGECADILVGYPFKSELFNSESKGIRLVRGKNISRSGIRWGSDTKWWDIEDIELSKYLLHENDIVIAMDGNVGDNLARLTKNDVPSYLVQRVACIRPKKGHCSSYLWACISSPSFRGYCNSIKTGTTISHISSKQIADFEIPKFSIKEETTIGEILDLFDKKIVLNNQINADLEQFASARYQKIFASKEPMVPISDYKFALESGKRPKGGIDCECREIPSIGAENVKSLGFYDFSKTKFISRKYFDSMKKGVSKDEKIRLYIYKDGGTPGNYIPHFSLFGKGFPYPVFSINEHVFQLDFGSEKLNAFSYFFFNTEQIRHELGVRGGKAAIPGIGQSAIMELKTFDLNSKEVVDFSEFAYPIILQILLNSVENCKLRSLCDSLISKLLLGEIDPSNIKRPN